MENYFESLNENDMLVYGKELTLESGETLPDIQSQKWLDWRCWCSSLSFMGGCDALPHRDS